MYIKVTTTRTKDKTYRYVKVARATWSIEKGSQEEIVTTIGTLEEVIDSRASLIKGLTALSLEETTRQTRGRRHSTLQPGDSGISYQTKKGRSRSHVPAKSPSISRIKPKRNKLSFGFGGEHYQTKNYRATKRPKTGRKSKLQTKKRR